jgi:cytochrome c oxidase cbb3-type subunit 2
VILRFHSDHRLLFGVLLGGFIALSVVIAVGPALRANAHNAPLPTSQPFTAEEMDGLGVYVAEGCLFCHTQQVRPLLQDRRFGRPSVPGDYARLERLDVWRGPPAVLGTERTGPDLSDIGRRQPSAVWHYIHLYQPRAVVQGSVMAALPWLFRIEEHPAPGAVTVPVPAPYAPARGQVVATARAQALVAYLVALKQAALPGTASGEEPAPAQSAAAGATDAGAAIYATRCAGCHQANGKGVPGAFPPLADDPVVTAADPTEQIRIVLFGRSGSVIGGVTYPAGMPAWAPQLSDAEMVAVVNHERTAWGNHAPTVRQADVAAVRRQGSGSGEAGHD